MINHSGCLTRSASACGSLKVEISTLLASSISVWVLCLMKTGLPCHLTTTFLPSGMAPKPTSTLAMAKTSAEAAMEVKKVSTVDLAPVADNKPKEPTVK
ncbi:hypothetical protein WICPIJ_005906 [Wickerhamomyces pijperi]|uniref:Uncharacterized protein n=1 Tax=Wickerhamomyces pijperi TaxID=599730 RepID=A0A9P8Q339_WICPI|nr:hypothetical protein WICPIJ_005906 [Wickerhamomyces pijperi]